MKAGKSAVTGSDQSISIPEGTLAQSNVGGTAVVQDIGSQISKARDELALGHRDDGIARLERLIPSESSSLEPAPQLGSAYALLGRAYRAQGDEVRAVEAFRRALPLLDANASTLTPEQWTDRGAVLYALNEFDEAVEALEKAKASEKEPSIVTLGFLGLALEQASRLEEAEHVLREAERVSPDEGVLVGVLARVAHTLGRPDASDIYRRAIELTAGMNDLAALSNEIEGLLELEPRSPFALSWKGELFRRLGEMDEATAALERALELDPEDAFAHASLGAALTASNTRLEEALEHLDRAVKLRKDYRFAQYWRCSALRSLGRYKEAVLAADELLQSVGDATDVLALKAVALREGGDLEEALVPIRHALEIDPNDADNRLILAETLEFMGEYQEALRELRRALKISPGHPLALGLMGRTLVRQGLDADAIEPLEESVKSAPDVWTANLLVDALLAVDRPEDAIAALDGVLAVQPANAGLLRSKGRALYGLSRWADAIEPLKASLDLEPDIVATIQLSDCLRAVSEPEEALKVAEWAVAMDPHDAAAAGTVAQALRALDRVPEALAKLQQAIEMDSSIAWLHTELGDTLLDEGRLDEALSAYEMALKYAPDDADILTLAASAERFLGRLDAAAARIRSAVALEPDNLDTRLEQAEIAAAAEDYMAGLTALDVVLEAQPDHERAMQLRGQLLVAAGRNEEALVALDEALRSDPDYGWGYVLRGMALNAIDRLSDALAALHEAVERGVDDAAAWAELAEVYSASGEGELAAETIDRANQADIDDWPPASRAWADEVRGVAYAYVGRLEEAEASLRSAYHHGPSLYNGGWLGDVLIKNGRGQEGEAFLREVISQVTDIRQLSPGDTANLGWAHRLLGQWDKAADLLVRALSKDAGLHWAQFDFALTLLAKGALGAALSEYERGTEELRVVKDPRRRFGLLSVALRDLEDLRAGSPSEPPEVVEIRKLLRANIAKAAAKRDALEDAAREPLKSPDSTGTAPA